MMTQCAALMGPLGWVMPLAMMLLLGLGIAALAKSLFPSRPTSRDLPEARP